MRRKALGRDFGLSVRMLVVGTILASLYAVLLFLAFALAWSDRSDVRAWFVPLFVIVLLYVHYRSADSLALAAIRPAEVEPEEEPELYSVVQKLSALADIPTPRLAVSPVDAPNAFAAGTSPRRARIVVTDGRRDAREWIFWPVIMVLAIVLFVFGKLLTFAISRYREYAADRGSVLLTGAPEQLMSALQKVTGDMALIPRRDLRALAGLNALFIIPAAVSRWEVAMDHPPLRKRLARLEEMARELGKAA